MAVPTSFSDLSTTAASNSPSGSETPAEGDNHFRITYAFLRSILDNSGNGWTSPYWALTATGPSISATTVTWSGNPTHSGNHTFSGNVTVQGNTTLGNAGTDTVTTNGNITVNAPTSGNTVTVSQVSGAAAHVASASISGAAVESQILNTSNTASSDARMFIRTAGSSAGDPKIGLQVSGSQDWSVGIDNSDSDTFKIDASNTLGSSNNWLNITTDGRVYGAALHNNAGAVTGTTNQYIASGTYTPTGTATTNIDSVSSLAGMWTRVGNVVSVSITASVDTTTGASTATTLGLSLPIASNFTAVSDCVGTCTTGGTGISGAGASVFADTANDRITVQWLANTTGATTIYLTAQYVVL